MQQAAADQASRPIKRRGAVACRRCRRLRSKCIHQSRDPPCDACRLAGPQVASECHFPRRGEQDVDRQFRRRQMPPPASSAAHDADQPHPSPRTASVSGGRSQGSSSGGPRLVSTAVLTPGTGFRIEDTLPPLDEIVEGCRVFITSYFQLGFLPKSMFLEDLVRNFASVDKFLLTCILSISARFTPVLASRYGDPRSATEHFLNVAKAMVPAEMYRPSLERIQAFFLLAICQWGNGDRDHSSMDMGVAVRMAALLKLHCEESYASDLHSPTEQVVRSESARRVFWMIQSQENLHSGYQTPAPFPLDDITTLLPSSEADFAFGIRPADRAALAGTPPAMANPELVHSPTRCLFASLIQAHGLWGRVARHSGGTGFGVSRAPPWDDDSDHQRTLRELREWESNIPPRHGFSVWNLRGWKSDSLHLAYLSISMVLRLSNIVSRRMFLEHILSSMSTSPVRADATADHPNMESHRAQGTLPDVRGEAPAGFWDKTSHELFANVWDLYEQIEAFFTMRAPDEGFPQILVFCVYTCGSLAAYLWRHPELCPPLADRAETMAQRTLEILSELHGAWPTSSRWQKGLQQAATPMTSTSPDDARAIPRSAAAHNEPSGHHMLDSGVDMPQHNGASGEGDSSVLDGTGLADELPPFSSTVNSMHPLGNGAFGLLPNDMFDAEVSSILQGDFRYDMMGSWGLPGFPG